MKHLVVVSYCSNYHLDERQYVNYVVDDPIKWFIGWKTMLEKRNLEGRVPYSHTALHWFVSISDEDALLLKEILE